MIVSTVNWFQLDSGFFTLVFDSIFYLFVAQSCFTVLFLWSLWACFSVFWPSR